jgi:hypothetical protein
MRAWLTPATQQLLVICNFYRYLVVKEQNLAEGVRHQRSHHSTSLITRRVRGLGTHRIQRNSLHCNVLR